MTITLWGSVGWSMGRGGGASLPQGGVAFVLCGLCFGSVLWIGRGTVGRWPWAGGHGHVCWLVSVTRALTFDDKRPNFQQGAPDQAMIPGTWGGRTTNLRLESDSYCESGPRESIRRKTPSFIACERFARLASNLRFAIFSPVKRNSQKMGVRFGNRETIRENQAIRANLRIDSRESGHLKSDSFSHLKQILQQKPAPTLTATDSYI